MTPPLELRGFEAGTSGGNSGRILAVILHGWNGSPFGLRDVRHAVREALDGPAGLDLYAPQLPYSRLLSFSSPTDITAGLLADLDRLGADSDRYENIILIGHSIGAVIARRLFLVAAGINDLVPSEERLSTERPRSWAKKVSRIVSIAGLNRGWVRSGRLGWLESAAAVAVAIAGHGWPGTKSPTLFEFRRGAPFVVQTRLQWLALQRDPAKPKPLMVQLLGTQDNLVAPDDAVDFAVDGRQNSYLYLELPQTAHADAIIFSTGRSDAGECRRKIFILAVAGEPEAVIKRSINRKFLADTMLPPPDEKVDAAVFVIHGIRDDGYWTRRVAQRINEAAVRHNRPIDTVRSITPSYGYFAMLPFIWPWIRREKVEWLMDEYVAAVAQFPCAAFSYVGHSNGTYLLARALKDYPAIRFRNVLFAGSVVRRDYDWGELIKQDRVHQIVNMVATADWVVAIFPSGLEWLRQFDLGGAGFGGFQQAGTEPSVHEVRYVTGGHGAALVETQWPHIAEFIVNDTIPAPPDPDYKPEQSWSLRIVAGISNACLAAGLLAALSPVYFLLRDVPGMGGLAAAGHAAAAFVYMIVLWFVVTRV